MSYKDYLLSNHSNYIKIKDMLDLIYPLSSNNPNVDIYTRTIIGDDKILGEKTISIVMTCCNRSEQTYYTLSTIKKSFYKNVQVILVDDSNIDLIDVSKLESFGLYIDYIHIHSKYWLNPCINYNIGFKYIRGGKIIIQNAEVCHIDDVINFVANNLVDEIYDVFNVMSLPNIEANKKLYLIDPIYSNYNQLIGLSFGSGIPWYQHHQHRNLCYHFLTAITRNTFDKVGGFDIDFAFGIEYDDNQLLMSIKIAGIELKNVVYPVMGIHQWHARSSVGSGTTNPSNLPLLQFKQDYFNKNNNYISFTDISLEEMNNILSEYSQSS